MFNETIGKPKVSSSLSLSLCSFIDRRTVLVRKFHILTKPIWLSLINKSRRSTKKTNLQKTPMNLELRRRPRTAGRVLSLSPLLLLLLLAAWLEMSFRLTKETSRGERHRKDHYNEFEIVRLHRHEIEAELRALEQDDEQSTGRKQGQSSHS